MKKKSVVVGISLKRQSQAKSRGARPKRPTPPARAMNIVRRAPAPVAVEYDFRQTQPAVTYHPSGTICNVSHFEQINAISAAGATRTTLSEIVNAGNSVVFPWLSGLALRFQFYKFTKLKFHYIPLCSSSSNGEITLATEPNVSETVITDDFVLASYDGTVQGQLWSRITHSVPTAVLNRLPKYMVSDVSSLDPTPGVSDPINYDVSRILAIVDGSSTTPSGRVGKLFVEYSVKLSVPQVVPGESLAIAGFSGDTGNCSNTHPLQFFSMDADSRGFTSNDGTPGSSFTFEFPGEYLFVIEVLAAAYSGTPQISFNGTNLSTLFSQAVYNLAAQTATYYYDLRSTTENVIATLITTGFTTLTSLRVTAATKPYASSDYPRRPVYKPERRMRHLSRLTLALMKHIQGSGQDDEDDDGFDSVSATGSHLQGGAISTCSSSLYSNIKGACTSARRH